MRRERTRSGEADCIFICMYLIERRVEGGDTVDFISEILFHTFVWHNHQACRSHGMLQGVHQRKKNARRLFGSHASAWPCSQSHISLSSRTSRSLSCSHSLIVSSDAPSHTHALHSQQKVAHIIHATKCIHTIAITIISSGDMGHSLHNI
jgi:hypothetical protein